MPVHKSRVDLEYSIDIKELVLLDTAIPDTLPYALLYVGALTCEVQQGFF